MKYCDVTIIVNDAYNFTDFERHIIDICLAKGYSYHVVDGSNVTEYHEISRAYVTSVFLDSVKLGIAIERWRDAVILLTESMYYVPGMSVENIISMHGKYLDVVAEKLDMLVKNKVPNWIFTKLMWLYVFQGNSSEHKKYLLSRQGEDSNNVFQELVELNKDVNVPL